MQRRLTQVGGWLLPFFEASAVGLIAGIGDVNRSSSAPIEDFAFVACVVFLGARHAGRAWVCWAPLGASFYLVHLAAIARGYQPPYVEPDAMAARACLTNFFPVTFLLVVGVLLRAGLSACGWFRPRDGSLVRVFPRTSRG
ncbi:hypothetical protein [Paludisphaera soli]|uniref:hypothetical protein n=1 Tax=Paludisphaera soli TaxID=2712865 RepID=UPI0013ED042B|nr:hypothetical protein [Paludisphaera soli]